MTICILKQLLQQSDELSVAILIRKILYVIQQSNKIADPSNPESKICCNEDIYFIEIYKCVLVKGLIF